MNYFVREMCESNLVAGVLNDVNSYGDSTAWTTNYGGSWWLHQDKESGANQKKIDGWTHQGTEHGLELEILLGDLELFLIASRRDP